MIRSTASSQFRVLDCSASIEVPDFPYHTDEADFSLSSLTPYYFRKFIPLLPKKKKFKYTKSCLLQFSRNEVPAKTEINNDEIIFHNTLSIRYMLHCCKPAFCVIYTMALFRFF